GDGAHETTIENAARELVPVFVFQGFQKSQADARGHNDFGGRDFAQLSLALQTFPKISCGHGSNPVLRSQRDQSAAGEKQRGAAVDSGAHSRKVWAPLDRTIGGGAKRVKPAIAPLWKGNGRGAGGRWGK